MSGIAKKVWFVVWWRKGIRTLRRDPFVSKAGAERQIRHLKKFPQLWDSMYDVPIGPYVLEAPPLPGEESKG